MKFKSKTNWIHHHDKVFDISRKKDLTAGMMETPKNNRGKIWLADLGLFYSAAIWGSTFFIVKDALDSVDPVILVGYRFLIAGAVLAPILFFTKKSFLKDIKAGLVLSLLLYFLYVPQTIGLRFTTASNSGFITGLFVAFVPIFLRTIFKRKPTITETIAAFISLIGLWILTGGLTQINQGDVITLAAAMTYALHVLFSDKYIKAGIDPIIITFQQFILIGLFSLVTGAIFDLPFTFGDTRSIGIIIFLALFPSLSAFIIQLLAQKIAPPMRVSLIFAFEPVFAGLFSWTLGDEPFVLRNAVGGAFIFAALVVSGIPIRKKK